MKRILFLDDEPDVLRGLQQMLRPMHDQWEMAFVTNGDQALAELEQSKFDVLVTDMRLKEKESNQNFPLKRSRNMSS